MSRTGKVQAPTGVSLGGCWDGDRHEIVAFHDESRTTVHVYFPPLAKSKRQLVEMRERARRVAIDVLAIQLARMERPAGRSLSEFSRANPDGFEIEIRFRGKSRPGDEPTRDDVIRFGAR